MGLGRPRAPLAEHAGGGADGGVASERTEAAAAAANEAALAAAAAAAAAEAAAGAASTAAAGEAWRRVEAPGGKAYWWNPATGQVQWEPPEAVAAPPPVANQLAEAEGRDGMPVPRPSLVTRL